MSFKVTPQDVKKSQKCSPGMHIFTLVAVEEPYLSEKGNTVQKCDFESDKGYVVSKWFNNVFMGDLVEFVECADDINIDPEKMSDMDIELKDYIGKKVAGSVSHGKDKNNKMQANIDNFFSAKKVPF